MPISLACDCGTKLKIKDEMAGRTVRCPRCSGSVSVPVAPKEDEVVDVVPADAPREEESYGLKPEPACQQPRLSDVPEPPSFRTRETRQPSPHVSSNEGGGFGSINGGVMGGFAMIAVAVVWFVLGLMANRIFIYPPILLVVGIISVIKGLAGGE